MTLKSVIEAIDRQDEGRKGLYSYCSRGGCDFQGRRKAEQEGLLQKKLEAKKYPSVAYEIAEADSGSKRTGGADHRTGSYAARRQPVSV